MRRVPVVLAGGNGARLWPLSRPDRPKTFLPLLANGRSPFQAAVSAAASIGRPLVLCREQHRFLAREQLSELELDAELLLEPSPRGGGAALGLAAWRCALDEELLVLPAELLDAVPEDAPHPGWHVGEDEQGVAWDLVSVAVLRQTLVQLCGETLATTFERAAKSISLDLGFWRVAESAWQDVPHLEAELVRRSAQATRVRVPDRLSLSDWEAVHRASSLDDSGNAIFGDVLLSDSTGCLVRAESRLVATLGVQDLVVVETADAVLVTSRERADDVRGLRNELVCAGRAEATHHRRELRPWGSFEAIGEGPRWKAKRIVVQPGHALSLQRHNHRAEHWVVVRGTAQIQRGDERFALEVDASTYIPQGVVHRLENIGDDELVLIEVQTGDHLHEDDIERIDDRYGRSVGTETPSSR
ncbi:MAG: sugar phosphate nucleotidyltransferase [Myxococcota bacterium]